MQCNLPNKRHSRRLRRRSTCAQTVRCCVHWCGNKKIIPLGNGCLWECRQTNHQKRRHYWVRQNSCRDKALRCLSICAPSRGFRGRPLTYCKRWFLSPATCLWKSSSQILSPSRHLRPRHLRPSALQAECPVCRRSSSTPDRSLSCPTFSLRGRHNKIWPDSR